MINDLKSMTREELISNYVVEDETWIYYNQNYNK